MQGNHWHFSRNQYALLSCNYFFWGGGGKLNFAGMVVLCLACHLGACSPRRILVPQRALLMRFVTSMHKDTAIV